MFDGAPAAGAGGRAGQIDQPLVPRDQSRDHLGEQDDGEDQAGEEIIGEARAQFGEIHVEHHHHEQEEHGDRADVDDDQQEGEELGPDQQEQAGRVEEGEDQPEHASAPGCATRSSSRRRR